MARQTPWSGGSPPGAQRASGRIGAWGITGVGVPATIIKALGHDLAPQVVQAVGNLLDSAGSMRSFAGPAVPRQVISAATGRGIGVMGIRAVQAGALTEAIDRPLKADDADALDYQKAAPFRALCAAMGADPALVAHRYALGIKGVDSVVIGVKNRVELAQCLEAEALGPLDAETVARVEALGLR